MADEQKKEVSEEKEEKVQENEATAQQSTETKEETDAKVDVDAEKEKDGENDKLAEELEKAKNDYLYLRAEYDNYRKRTMKEKAELIVSGGEKVLKNILPVVDDFERGIAAAEKTEDVQAVKEGMKLIYDKFMKFLEQEGVKPIEAKGQKFDTDYHESIALVPVEDEAQDGVVLDCVQTGYTLGEKVIRYARVAVGKK